jgi:hypothetical protein
MARRNKTGAGAARHTRASFPDRRPGVLALLAAWLLLSIPLSLFAARFIAAGQGGAQAG